MDTNPQPQVYEDPLISNASQPEGGEESSHELPGSGENEQPVAAKATETEAVDEPVVPTQEQAEWDDSIVQFAAHKGMLYVPRPRRPMIVLEVTRDLMIPRGHFLGVDVAGGFVQHITPGELEAGLRPANRSASNIAEAMAAIAEVVTPPPPSAAPQVAPEPEPQQPITATPPEPAAEQPIAPPEPAPQQPFASPERRRHEPVYQPDAEQPDLDDEPELDNVEATAPAAFEDTARRAPERRQPTRTAPTARPPEKIGPQLGRLLVTMTYVFQTENINKIDSNSLGEYLDDQDRRSVTTLLSQAKSKGWVLDAGPLPSGGRARLYCLSSSGRRMAQDIGDAPFTAVGKRSPFSKGKTTARPTRTSHVFSE